ncbi:MAG: hypothetical protein KGJ87_05255 [Planctomycetota bacterium]|nr:hypothetical protein [Planctomycetota bacterium]
MNNGNVVTMNFRVSPRLKELIEKHASSKKIQVSAYIREAILFEMIESGNTDAFEFVAPFGWVGFTGVVRNMLKKLRQEKEGG